MSINSGNDHPGCPDFASLAQSHRWTAHSNYRFSLSNALMQSNQAVDHTSYAQLPMVYLNTYYIPH